MSKSTVSAAGGAMPAEGQFVPRTRLGAQINIADAFDQTHGLIIAASNMAAALEDTEAQGLHPVILAIEEQFDVVRDWYLVRHAGAPTSESIARQAETEVSQPHDKASFAKVIKFERLHRDYLAAQAAYADPDGPDDDEVKGPLSDKKDATELALLVQPSPATWGIWVKWEILDRLVTTDAEAGHYVENRIITALGAIKADIIRFGINT